MAALTKRFADDGTRLTDCCGAYSTFHDETLCCKACHREVEFGQGDGSERRADDVMVCATRTTELPWRATGSFVVDAADREVCEVRQTLSRPSAEAAADLAHLIAAAPEMLAALREIVGQDRPNRWGYDAATVAMDDGWRERARAALARATKPL